MQAGFDDLEEAKDNYNDNATATASDGLFIGDLPTAQIVASSGGGGGSSPPTLRGQAVARGGEGRGHEGRRWRHKDGPRCEPVDEPPPLSSAT